MEHVQSVGFETTVSGKGSTNSVFSKFFLDLPDVLKMLRSKNSSVLDKRS